MQRYLLSFISAVLVGLYGLLNAYAGISQLKAKSIQAWSAWLMLGAGALLIVSGAILFLKLPAALIALAAGLIAIHALTINNGLHLYGALNPSHHLRRLAISVFLFGLAFWSLQ